MKWGLLWIFPMLEKCLPTAKNEFWIKQQSSLSSLQKQDFLPVVRVVLTQVSILNSKILDRHGEGKFDVWLESWTVGERETKCSYMEWTSKRVLDFGPTLFQNTCPSHHCRGLKSSSSSSWCLLTFSVQLDEFVPLWKGQRLDCPIEHRILHFCISEFLLGI